MNLLIKQDKAFIALLRWLEIREANGRPFPHSFGQFCADIDHSCLLQRLYEGIEPLPEVPPRAMSCPWYKLLEEGEDYAYEIFFDKTRREVVIEQFIWKIVEEISDDEYIVNYGQTSSWRLLKTNEKWPDNKNKWLVKRIDF